MSNSSLKQPNVNNIQKNLIMTTQLYKLFIGLMVYFCTINVK